MVVLVSKVTVAKRLRQDYRNHHDQRSNRHYQVDAQRLMSRSSFCAEMQRREDETRGTRGDEEEERGGNQNDIVRNVQNSDGISGGKKNYIIRKFPKSDAVKVDESKTT